MWYIMTYINANIISGLFTDLNKLKKNIYINYNHEEIWDILYQICFFPISQKGTLSYDIFIFLSVILM